MLKNSREVFDQYLIDIVPTCGLTLAKAQPADFAVYDFAGPVAALALLQVARAFNARRFVGHIGIVAGERVEVASRGRILLHGGSLTHIFNVEPLLASAYIDEMDAGGSVKRFVENVGQQFDRLSRGVFDRDLDQFDETFTLTPVATPLHRGA